MKKLLIVIFLLFSCAPIRARDITFHETTPEMKALYSPVQEFGFCLAPDGTIYNMQQYNFPVSMMFSPPPKCYQDAIMMHSHPIWGEPFASISDYLVWKAYNKKYGNEYFGIMKKNWYKVYRIQGN